MNDYAGRLLSVIAAPSSQDKAEVLAGIEPPLDGTRWDPPALPHRPGRPAGWIEGEPPRRHKGLKNRTARLRFLHAIHHIECSAIDLAVLLCLRASGAPNALHREFLRIAAEEAGHAALVERLLIAEGFPPGTDPVHHRLWDSAVAAGDLGAQLVVVPRFLEARGLDVSAELLPRMAAIDPPSHAVLQRIYQDEITHVAAGSRWHGWWCADQGRDHLDHFSATVQEHFATQVPGAFALDLAGRRAAGFTEAEIAVLQAPPWAVGPVAATT